MRKRRRMKMRRVMRGAAAAARAVMRMRRGWAPSLPHAANAQGGRQLHASPAMQVCACCVRAALGVANPHCAGELLPCSHNVLLLVCVLVHIYRKQGEAHAPHAQTDCKPSSVHADSEEEAEDEEGEDEEGSDAEEGSEEEDEEEEEEDDEDWEGSSDDDGTAKKRKKAKAGGAGSSRKKVWPFRCPCGLALWVHGYIHGALPALPVCMPFATSQHLMYLCFLAWPFTATQPLLTDRSLFPAGCQHGAQAEAGVCCQRAVPVASGHLIG